MEASEERNNTQLSLQWHQHHDTLVSLLDMLWEKQELVDVTLVAADGRCIEVHRIVLCACSKYFKDVLTMKSNSGKHAIVFLKDVSHDDLKALVDYMYKGEVRINEDQLNSFLHSAKSLGVRGLMGDEKKNQISTSKKRSRKRRRSSSVGVSEEGEGEEEEEEDENQVHEPVQPHHQSNRIEVNEPLPNKFETELDLDMQTDSVTRNSGLSVQETEDDDLDLFSYAAENNTDTGSLRLSAEEIHPSHHHHQASVQQRSAVAGPSFRTSTHRFPCLRCNRDYSTADLLKRHLRFECGVEPQFQCPVCLKRVRHKHNLTAHMKTHWKETGCIQFV